MPNQLNNWSTHYNQEDNPVVEIENAIASGMAKAKVAIRKRKRQQLSLVAFMSFWLGLTVLINVSPTFANQLGRVPGMEQFVDFFQFDRGKLAAVEHNYYQPIGQVTEVGPFIFTIEGAIRDSRDLVLFYTLEGEAGMDGLSFDIEDVTANGVAVEDYSYAVSFGQREEENAVIFDTIAVSTVDPFEAERLEIEVEFIGQLNGKIITERAIIPITVQVMGGEQYYDLNETLNVAGQTFYIHGVTIFPLKAEVEISADPNNTMRVLSIDDLALIDEEGDSWTKLMTGMVGFGDLEDGGMKVYLQSNYFEAPESLTLFFSKIQAVPKDADYLLIDLDDEKILHDPYGKYSLVTYNGKELSIIYDKEQGFDEFLGYELTSPEGDELNVTGFSFIQGDQQNRMAWDVETNEPIVKLNLAAYPHWLEEAVRLKLY
ncbi:protein of unknown function [Amphibacillus marinus]|uniref:DUF4179 domain-containing protein n=1 Tax=Amphibacillus marinus TaxID=872970 RepID=A0A1H8S6U3_9BACI|nr:DUF4179 domain-containing protein [Amphibacillus marinus]SEO74256.1 protein of unknown function [Amphibacillus marinus]